MATTSNSDDLPTHSTPRLVLLWYQLVLAISVAYILSGHHFGQNALVGFNLMRVFQVVLMCMPLIVLIHPRARRRALERKASCGPWVNLAFWIFLFAGLVSGATANRPVLALQELALMVLVCWAILSQFARPNNREFLLGAAFLSVVILGYWVKFYFEFLSILSIERARISSAIMGFANFRFLNQVQAWILPLMLAPWLISTGKVSSVWVNIGKLGSIFFASLLFASGGRGIMLAFMASILIMYFALQADGKTLAKAAIKVGFLGFLLYVVAIQIPYFANQGALDSYNAFTRLEEGVGVRSLLWSTAIESWLANPIFGLGPQHFVLVSPEAAHPHNLVLRLLSELGIVGAASALFLISALLWITWKNSRKICPKTDQPGTPQSLIPMLLCMSLVTGVTYSLVDGVFLMPYSMISFVLVASMAVAFRTTEISGSAGMSRGFAMENLAVLSVVVLAGIFLVWSTVNDFPAQLQSTIETDHKFYPRFWVDGFWNRPQLD